MALRTSAVLGKEAGAGVRRFGGEITHLYQLTLQMNPPPRNACGSLMTTHSRRSEAARFVPGLSSVRRAFYGGRVHKGRKIAASFFDRKMQRLEEADSARSRKRKKNRAIARARDAKAVAFAAALHAAAVALEKRDGTSVGWTGAIRSQPPNTTGVHDPTRR